MQGLRVSSLHNLKLSFSTPMGASCLPFTKLPCKDIDLQKFQLICGCIEEANQSAKRSRGYRIMPQVPGQTFISSRSSTTRRIYTISDVHTDYPDNLKWLKELSSTLYQEDTLIVAGDVAEKLETFVETMAVLKERFKHIFYVPGNHDLWCRGKEIKHVDSLLKLKKLLDACELLGVETKPRIINDVGIIPLFSWYHQSFDRESDITDFKIPPLKLVCMDFHACKWPDASFNTDGSLAHFFDELNACNLECVEEIKKECKQIITFSHFVPRPELCPEKRMLFYPNLTKVIGSDLLERRLRNIHGLEGNPSACHIFGHTHFCWDTTLEGIRYVQAPLAYPRERYRRINGGEDWLPFCIYDTDIGFAHGPVSCFWSDYYRANDRDPTNIELAPWVRRFYRISTVS